MIVIQVGSTPDENKKLNKTFNVRTTVQGEIFTPCDITAPQLRFASEDILKSDTYFFIPDFNRYYFLSKVDKAGDIVTLTLAVDVLMSFNEDIKKCPLIAERSSNIFNAYLQDNERNFLNYSKNQFINLGSFSGQSLYLYGVG